MKTSTPKHDANAWWAAACFVPLLTYPAARAFNIPMLAAPWLVVVLLAPFVAAWARRVWRASEREKQALQEKFNREDAALIENLRG